MNNKIKKIIEKLNLAPHIEGGYFKRTYQSSLEIDLNNKKKAINSAIYYLLESHDFSCWHRLKSDEIWHYYCGSNVMIHQINQQGVLSSMCLGNILEDTHAEPQCIIPAGTWFAANVESPKSFALVGCSVAPGFEYDDFEMGEKNNLLAQYPQHEKIILQFIRTLNA